MRAMICRRMTAVVAAVLYSILLTVAMPSAYAQDGRKSTLAVVDFEVKGGIEQKQAGEIVAGLFGTSLSTKYSIVERQYISKVIEEQEFRLSDLVSNREKTIRIGELLGADYVVVGVVSQLGTTVTVEARVVNVQSGEWGERGYIYCEGISEVPKNLPALLAKMKLLGEGGLDMPTPKHITSPQSAREQEFNNLFAEADAMLKAGNPFESIELASKALELPGYKQNEDVEYILQKAAESVRQNKQLLFKDRNITLQESLRILKHASELNPDNAQIQQAISGLKEMFSIGKPKQAVIIVVRAGQTINRDFAMDYPDEKTTISIKASLDANVETWQYFKRYSSSDVRKTYGSNEGRLRISISAGMTTIWTDDFPGELIAELGRNWQDWEIPHFDQKNNLPVSINWGRYCFMLRVGSTGSRWTESSRNNYPRGRIESAYIDVKYVLNMD